MLMSFTDLDTRKLSKILISFIRDFCTRSGFGKVVLGLSGGLDSTVVAYLACRALGRRNVLALSLPYKSSDPQALRDARKVVRTLAIRSKVIDITPMVDAYYRRFPDKDRVRKGNKLARERMSVLYDFSAREKALVIGTGNKTEILLGYSTIHGDGAYAFNPIGDLYKSQVRLLAKELGVPQEIIDKPPSADLWKGQTDEDELGATYEEMDRFLYYMVDKKLGPAGLKRMGYKPAFIKRVVGIMKRNEFKGKPPEIARLSYSKLKAG
jgi:NAD+ synthase